MLADASAFAGHGIHTGSGLCGDVYPPVWPVRAPIAAQDPPSSVALLPILPQARLPLLVPNLHIACHSGYLLDALPKICPWPDSSGRISSAP